MRLAAAIEYDGSAFHGWQSQQEGVRTVQGAVEKALSQIANEPVRVVCAGRTDAGVHAHYQIIHFDTPVPRSERAWTYGGNTKLPDDVAIKWSKPVVGDFHARFSAVSRRYRYVIYNSPIRPAVSRAMISWDYRALDAFRMQEAANHLLGKHDFSSYRAVACQSKSAVREITDLNIHRNKQFVVIEIEANAFLQHMVRNIAGVLIAIGSGERDVDWSKEVLMHQDRCKGGVTAPPNGLSLIDVKYPAQFELPASEPRSLFT